jgi:hypothetical protein
MAGQSSSTLAVGAAQSSTQPTAVTQLRSWRGERKNGSAAWLVTVADRRGSRASPPWPHGD